MSFYVIIGVCLLIIFIVSVRLELKYKSRKLTDIISQLDSKIPKPQEESESSTAGTQEIREALVKKNQEPFKSIVSYIDTVYADKYISARDEHILKEHFQAIYDEANSLYKMMRTFNVEPSQSIKNLIGDYTRLHQYKKEHNEKYLGKILEDNHSFFDHCLKYPLDAQQRRSIVSEEDNCLVVSSAGSGKTSSIVGKVKYLIEKKHVKPENILLISYTNKAAAELTERMGTPGLKGYTFHKLAIDLLGQITGTKPSICDNTDALFVRIYRELLDSGSDLGRNIVRYFVDFQINEDEREKRRKERCEQLSEQKRKTLRALLPDMDGHPIYVRSEQEQKICFALSSLGVDFRYEEPYEHPVADGMHSQYKPDFSIYYKDGDETHRVYLEHFGVDEQGLVPAWFATEKGISYEEANQKYGDGIEWKRATHEKYGTRLIFTTSADFMNLDNIKSQLQFLLKKEGVPLHEKSDSELYAMVLPKGSKQEKAFIRLVVTFVTLLKSSCKSIKQVISEAERDEVERNVFIIKHIFAPIYERYESALKASGQLDFTDLILQATQACKTSMPVHYDYIIVDEFQDISVDRYNFLRVLRAGNPPAKLYCVGDDWQSIYRFSGSDMALFNRFEDYFGATDVNKIETTYRFGEPLVGISARFIQCNHAQIKKNIHPFDAICHTGLEFKDYDPKNYCTTLSQLVASIPQDKSIFLLGRYSFDDYYLSFKFESIKEGNRFYYMINNRKIEFLTVHKSKGLEADYVILLQCNKDVYGFPSLVSDDPVLNYVLTQSDQYPFGEERRLFYVAITRAKEKTIVMYDNRYPSVFVDEFLHPQQVTAQSYSPNPNANKRWTKAADKFLLTLYNEGKSIKYISQKMGRSQTSIVMRLGKLEASKK